MKTFNHRTVRVLALGGLVVLLTFLAAFKLGVRASLANEPVGQANPPQMVAVGASAPMPDQVFSNQATLTGSVSNQLSYYFISGNTFTPGGNVPYVRQVSGCVNQMPPGIDFSSPVHLPQGSQVISMTLYTYNSDSDASASTASFIFDSGMGFGGYTISAKSQIMQTGYQHNISPNNPWMIDNENYNYRVSWRKDLGGPASPNLSLCGVRVAYYAPLGAVYLPSVAH